MWSRTSSAPVTASARSTFGRLSKCPCELGVTGFGMFSEGDEDEGFDGQFDLLVINDGSDSLDSAVAAELLDPSEGGGGRKPETAGELDVRQVTAYL